MIRSSLIHLALISWGLLLFHPGCGTDVGNSGKPIAQESSELAAVAGMQHDEVISSVQDDGDTDSAGAMALTGSQVHAPSRLAETSLSCQPNDDGSATVISSKSLALETEFGRPNARKVQTDTLDATRDITYSVPVSLGKVSCSPSQRPILTLAQLGQLTTQAEFTRSRKRSVTWKADGSVISQSELSVNSRSSVQFSTSGSLKDGLTVRRTSTLDSSVKLLRRSKEGALTRSVATLEAEPIVLEKTRSLGSGVTRVEIVSGAVVSTHQDAKKVVLRYRNLVLSLGQSCHPSSGSIEGQIFASSSATEAEGTFALVFDRDGATLVHEDGTEEDVELENCQL
jgi:hypothetical protein